MGANSISIAENSRARQYGFKNDFCEPELDFYFSIDYIYKTIKYFQQGFPSVSKGLTGKQFG